MCMYIRNLHITEVYIKIQSTQEAIKGNRNITDVKILLISEGNFLLLDDHL